MRRHLPVLFIVPVIACGPFFYEAPPPIQSYPERIGTKSWQELFQEVSPARPDLSPASGPDAMVKEITGIPDTAGRLEKTGQWIEENRQGDFSPQRANFLNELKELAGDSAIFESAKPYLEWRARHVERMPLESLPEIDAGIGTAIHQVDAEGQWNQLVGAAKQWCGRQDDRAGDGKNSVKVHEKKGPTLAGLRKHATRTGRAVHFAR